MLFVSGEGYLRFGSVIGHIGSLHLRLVPARRSSARPRRILVGRGRLSGAFSSYVSYGGIQRI